MKSGSSLCTCASSELPVKAHFRPRRQALDTHEGKTFMLLATFPASPAGMLRNREERIRQVRHCVNLIAPASAASKAGWAEGVISTAADLDCWMRRPCLLPFYRIGTGLYELGDFLPGR